MKTVIIALLSILLQESVHGTHQTCTWHGYRKCANNLPSLGSVVPDYYSNEQLAKLCTNWDVKKTCVDDLIDACEEEATDAHVDDPSSAEPESGSLILEEGSLDQQNVSMTTDPQQQQPSSEQSSTTSHTARSVKVEISSQPTSRPLDSATSSASTSQVKSTTSYKSQIDSSTENERTTLALRELQNGYKFFCDGYKRSVYRQEYRPCMVKKLDELRQASAECQSGYDNVTMGLFIDHPPHYQNICSAANDFYKCQSDSARELCSGKASTWLKEYHMALWKTRLQDLACKKGRLLDEGSLGIVLVCSGSLVVTIVLSVVSIYAVKPKEPSRFGNEQSETNMNAKDKGSKMKMKKNAKRVPSAETDKTLSSGEETGKETEPAIESTKC